MHLFHPAVQRWFARTFESPSPVQVDGWPAIRSGRDVLLSAPTGSGKTLAAFLWAIDELVRTCLEDGPPKGPQIVYVSPLKALGNDIEKNLREPLRGILEEAGLEDVVRVAVRTGDSLPADRRRLLKKPPHILITTPESLYLLLTAHGSRPILQSLRTVIVDEIHALAPNKRGAHLLLSLARLDRLCGRRLQRIGLSATQKPLERVGAFLSGDVPCTLVETPLQRPRHLSIYCPVVPLSSVASQELWADVCDHLATVIAGHRTTLIFTHTRRLAERLTRQLADRIGSERITSHHGSLSRQRRLDAEQRLKAGQLSALVATASLELGIDIGHVDIVCHIGAPRTIGSLLQRVGRSGRSLGTDSVGVLFPLTRDDLVQSAAAVRAVSRGELDALIIPPGPTDILAQQIVAMAAAEVDGVPCEEVLAMVRQCDVYRTLSSETFYRIVAMMADGSRPLAYWDRLHQRLHARPGSLLTSLTNVGAIADTGDYDVVELPLETPVGKLNEDYAIESMAGDVFLLGSTAWRIHRVGRGKVYVEAAPGQNAGIPFWLGEAPGRSLELSQAVAGLRLEVADMPLQHAGLDAEGWSQLRDYIESGRSVLGTLPGPRRVVAERFFDDSGGMQLVIHAPFGIRINRAWGLALRKRFCVTFDFELQAAATDDGVLISLSRRHSFELLSVFDYVHPASLHDDLIQAVLQAPIFGSRFRANASRALLLPRSRGGKKVPLPIQRMKAEDLLASVFPEQVMCQDNRTGPILPPDHPLVNETLRDCLEDWMDEPGLRTVLEDLRAGRIERHAIDTVTPSALCHEILNAAPYAFLDDAPLEERRARAVSTLGPTQSGGLDLDVIRQVEREAWPLMTDPHTLHHVLSRLGWIGGEELHAHSPLLAALLGDGRVVRGDVGGRTVYAARETAAWLSQDDPDIDARMIDGWMECLPPVTVAALARRTGLSAGRIGTGLVRLETQGRVLQGHFTPGQPALEWCHRDRLARIHRETLRRLRAAVEPVSLARWGEFVAAFQVRDSVEEAVLQLQGMEMAGDDWIATLGGRAADLEMLCLTGAVGWARLTPCADRALTLVPASALFSPSSTPRRTFARDCPVSCMRRDAHAWLAPVERPTASPAATALWERLRDRGARFAHELGGDPGRVAEGLEELAALGLASTDGLAPWRGQTQGRWFAWPDPETDLESRTEKWAAQLLRRYGVVFRRLLDFEPVAPPWTALRRMYAAMELRGDVLAGHFVAGVSGEQFAMRTAVAWLRTGPVRSSPLASQDPIQKVIYSIEQFQHSVKTPSTSSPQVGHVQSGLSA